MITLWLGQAIINVLVLVFILYCVRLRRFVSRLTRANEPQPTLTQEEYELRAVLKTLPKDHSI